MLVPPTSRSSASGPTVSELARNLTIATAKWVASGFKVTSQTQYAARVAACDACPKWDSSARFGLGKCQACGCTRFKRWLASEKCPLGKWPA